MSNAVVGILIILFLIILNCGRLFFLKFGRVDVLTLLAPLCVILSILQIIAWKADFFSLILLGISVFCFCELDLVHSVFKNDNDRRRSALSALCPRGYSQEMRLYADLFRIRHNGYSAIRADSWRHQDIYPIVQEMPRVNIQY